MTVADMKMTARQKAVKYGLDPQLFVRQITQESAWDCYAVNRHSGAMGLGQFMPETAIEMGLTLKTIFDPRANLDASACYMARLLNAAKGEYRIALAMYNFGIGNVRRGKPWPKETQQYVAKIMGDKA
jgi:soluble lytic murein transglycosylase-like protein